MINSQELIKISIENSSDKIEKCINEIQERLTTAAKKGEFSYNYNGSKYFPGLLHYVAKILFAEGYKVEYKNSMLEISWYDTEIKQTKYSEEKKTENYKQNKPVQKSEGNKTTRKDSTISTNTEG